MRQRGREEAICVVQKGIGRTTSHATTILHVQDGQLRAHGGWAMGSEEDGRGGRGDRGAQQAVQAL
jgi:hypothetical protein